MTVNVPDRFKAANAFWIGLETLLSHGICHLQFRVGPLSPTGPRISATEFLWDALLRLNDPHVPEIPQSGPVDRSTRF